MRCVPQLWLMILSAGYGIASPLARQAATIVIEAEDGQLSGTQISTNGSGFSGTLLLHLVDTLFLQCTSFDGFSFWIETRLIY